jgi:hypothetical protein
MEGDRCGGGARSRFCGTERDRDGGVEERVLRTVVVVVSEWLVRKRPWLEWGSVGTGGGGTAEDLVDGRE